MLPYTVFSSQLYNACAHSCSNFIKEAGLIISKKHIYLQGRLTIWLLSDLFINHTWSDWQQHLALTPAFGTDTISFSGQLQQWYKDIDKLFNRIREILEVFQPSACQHMPYISVMWPETSQPKTGGGAHWQGPCVQNLNGREWLYPGQLETGPQAADRPKVLPQTHTSTLSWKSKLQQL